jgi:hypothetical protein
MSDFVVWAADVGSIPRGRFGWWGPVRRGERVDKITDEEIEKRKCIDELARRIAEGLSNGGRIALGFECPLFVPVAAARDPGSLSRARAGESNRAWSAGGGAYALTTGLTQCVWVFERIRNLSSVPIEPTFDWSEFVSEAANLFIWEAFVSGRSKAATHWEDAKTAVESFWNAYPGIVEANVVTAQNPYSLVGAALLRSGLTTDLSVLSKPCIVIKSKRPAGGNSPGR